MPKKIQNYKQKNSSFVIRHSSLESGLTLIETIIYVAFLGMISVLIVNFMLQASRSYQVMQADREVLSNAR